VIRAIYSFLLVAAVWDSQDQEKGTTVTPVATTRGGGRPANL
jgi:hypothetical protein